MQAALKKHVLFTKAEEVKQICAPLKYLDIPGFIFMRHFPDGRFIDLSTILDWSESFLTRYFDLAYDPKDIQDHMYIENNVSLWSLNPNNIIWQEGGAFFEYGNGISITVKHNNYQDTFCYYGAKQDYHLNEFLVSNLNCLKKFSYYFVEQAHDIIQQGERNQLMTPAKYLQKVLPQNARPIAEDKLAQFNRETSLGLTPRELECIYLSAQGLSAKDVAQQLFVSQRTVETHFNNAKRKLKCRNINQLIHLVSRLFLE